MGIDCSPFWANLFLYSYEEIYTRSLISSDKVKPSPFDSAKCVIDDTFLINDVCEFGKNIFKDISNTA